MSHWVRHLTGLLEDIALRDASGRVARHLLQAGQDARGRDAGRGAGIIGLAGLKKHIASHLNLTSETFSRVLADGGLVELVDEKHLRIVDRKELESLSE